MGAKNAKILVGFLIAVNKNKNMEEFLQKKVLIAKNRLYLENVKAVKEVKILKISHSGKWVKIKNSKGRKYWKHKDDIEVMEIIPSNKKDNSKYPSPLRWV